MVGCKPSLPQQIIDGFAAAFELLLCPRKTLIIMKLLVRTVCCARARLCGLRPPPHPVLIANFFNRILNPSRWHGVRGNCLLLGKLAPWLAVRLQCFHWWRVVSHAARAGLCGGLAGEPAHPTGPPWPPRHTTIGVHAHSQRRASPLPMHSCYFQSIRLLML